MTSRARVIVAELAYAVLAGLVLSLAVVMR